MPTQLTLEGCSKLSLHYTPISEQKLGSLLSKGAFSLGGTGDFVATLLKGTGTKATPSEPGCGSKIFSTMTFTTIIFFATLLYFQPIFKRFITSSIGSLVIFWEFQWATPYSVKLKEATSWASRRHANIFRIRTPAPFFRKDKNILSITFQPHLFHCHLFGKAWTPSLLFPV